MFLISLNIVYCFTVSTEEQKTMHPAFKMLLISGMKRPNLGLPWITERTLRCTKHWCAKPLYLIEKSNRLFTIIIFCKLPSSIIFLVIFVSNINFHIFYFFLLQNIPTVITYRYNLKDRNHRFKTYFKIHLYNLFVKKIFCLEYIFLGFILILGETTFFFNKINTVKLYLTY